MCLSTLFARVDKFSSSTSEHLCCTWWQRWIWKFKPLQVMSQNSRDRVLNHLHMLYNSSSCYIRVCAELGDSVWGSCCRLTLSVLNNCDITHLFLSVVFAHRRKPASEATNTSLAAGTSVIVVVFADFFLFFPYKFSIPILLIADI